MILASRFRGPRYRQPPIRRYDRLPSKETLAALVRICSSKTRASVLLLASSGMRIGELVRLRLGDLDLSNDPPAIVVRDALQPHKSRVSYITGEARHAVESYLAERRRRGEDLGGESPLFAYESGTSMTPQAMISLIRRGFEAAGIRSPRIRLDSQILRRWFMGQLIRTGVPRAIVDFLCGRPNRARPAEDEVRRWYIRAIPNLTIVASAAT